MASTAKAFVLLTFLLFFMGFIQGARAESPDDILIIVNKTVPKHQLTIQELRDFYLKVRREWESGARTVPLNAREGTKIRDEFRRRVLGMSQTQEMRFWQTQKVKTGTQPPADFPDLQRAVFKLRGAVGYIYRSHYKPGATKVVLVLEAGK